jgi:hypothetical protein
MRSAEWARRLQWRMYFALILCDHCVTIGVFSVVLQAYMGFERRYHAHCASSKVATVQGCHGAQ